jgi:hypothetical protein
MLRNNKSQWISNIYIKVSTTKTIDATVVILISI